MPVAGRSAECRGAPGTAALPSGSGPPPPPALAGGAEAAASSAAGLDDEASLRIEDACGCCGGR